MVQMKFFIAQIHVFVLMYMFLQIFILISFDDLLDLMLNKAFDLIMEL